MDGEGLILFYEVAVPICLFIIAIVAIVGIIVHKNKKRMTLGVWICLIIVVFFAGCLIAELLCIRHDNISYWEHNDDYIESGNTVQFKDYMDQFTYEGEEWTTISYIPFFTNGFDDLELAYGSEDEYEVDWLKKHITLNAVSKQSFGDWLAAYQNKEMLFKLDIASGIPVYKVPEGSIYFCRPADKKKILAFYTDLRNYDFYVSGKKVSPPPDDVLLKLASVAKKKGERASWATKEYESKDGLKEYYIDVRSKDKACEGRIKILRHNGWYYVYEWDTIESEDSPYYDEDVFYVSVIPDEIAETLKPYIQLYNED